MRATGLCLQIALISTIATPLLAQRPASAELRWPSEPEPARIAYVGSLSSERDIGKGPSFFGRIFNAILGRSVNYSAVSRPNDVLVTGNAVFVSDGSIGKLIRFDLELRESRTIGYDEPGAIGKAVGLGGDADGNVYVADQARHRITVFDAQGNYLRSVGGPEHLLNPVDVAVDPIDGRIHVADSHLHQIVTFSSDGELLGRLGVTDALPADVRERHARAEDSNEPRGPIDAYQNRSGEPGEFRFPLSLAVTRDGTLYVSDGLNFRVQVFDRFGNYVRQIGELGDGPGSFARPKGIAVDSYGHLYVADASFNNVQVFDAEGNLLLAFAEGGQGEGQILLPLGLSLDAQDRIWIADRFNNRTQVFQYIAGSEGGGAIATEDVVTTAGEPAGSR